MNLVHLRSYVDNKAITLAELVSAVNYRYYYESLRSYVGHVGTDLTSARAMVSACFRAPATSPSLSLSFSIFVTPVTFLCPRPRELQDGT